MNIPQTRSGPIIKVEGIPFEVRQDAIAVIASGNVSAITELMRSKLGYYVVNCNTSRRNNALRSKADALWMQQQIIDLTHPVGPPGNLAEGDDPDAYTFEQLFNNKAPTMQPGQTLYAPVDGADVKWVPTASPTPE